MSVLAECVEHVAQFKRKCMTKDIVGSTQKVSPLNELSDKRGTRVFEARSVFASMLTGKTLCCLRGRS